MDVTIAMKKCIIHPYLFAVFPIVFLLAHNIEQTFFSNIIVPALFAVFITVFIFVILRFSVGDNKKAGLITSLFLILFFSFGHIRRLVEDFVIGGLDIGRDRHILLFSAAIFVLATYWILQTKKKLHNLTTVANVMAVTLVIIPLVSIGMYEFKRSPETEFPSENLVSDSDGALKKHEALPNIYYIILDGYAAQSTLKEIYNYDNAAFLQFLAERGFFVADESRSNYTQTFLSLSSSLNIRYINDLTEKVGMDLQNRAIPYQMIEDNTIWRFLNSRGYRFIHISSGSTEMTDKNGNADINFKGGKLDKFSLTLLETTALYPFIRHSVEADARERVLYSFDSLARISRLSGPRFTFAHILVPHSPYVFGPNGEKVENPKLQLSGDNYWKFKEHYVNQVIFTNKKIMALVEAILKTEKNPTIIIRQGDHGPASEGEGTKGLSLLKHILVKERMKIFNAYYLPVDGNKLLYKSITPVNSFRLIFSHYFGADYPLLEDESYFSTEEEPYTFINVTDIAREDY